MKRVHEFVQRRDKSIFGLHASHLILFFLTLLLVTRVLPVAAQYSPFDFRFSVAERDARTHSVDLGAENFGENPKSGQLASNLIIPNPISNTQNSNPSTQLEQGKTLYEAGRFAEAAALWQQAAESYEALGDRLNQAQSLSYLSLAYQDLGQWENAQSAIAQSLELLTNNQQPTTNNQQLLAQALNTKGNLLLATGQIEAALTTWKQAEAAYAQAGDEVGKLGTQINQAQALQTLGLYRRAQITLEQVNLQLQGQPDSFLKATGLRSLGDTLQVVGNLKDSQTVLEQSLSIIQRVDSSLDTSSILFSLGNTARALQDYEKALDYYQQAAAVATSAIAKLEAQLNQLSLLAQTLNQSCSSAIPACKGEAERREAIRALLSQIQPQLTNLPPSRGAVYAQVNFAESLIKYEVARMKHENSPTSSFTLQTSQLLAKAVQQARMLKDLRAESYALGQLGRLYQQTQQWADAQNLTQDALILAQGINAGSIAYRWQWQLGQILKQQGNLTGATAAYTEAVNTLQSLRSDLVAINPDVQFSFQESVEPVYRELVELLLQVPQFPPSQQEVSQNNLKQAREVIESLQLAELDNFFREACLNAKPEQIDQIDPTAAVIYPIILPNRLAVIVSLPGQPLRQYYTKLPQEEVESILEQTLQFLNPALSNKERLRLSQQVYDWLIRPAEAQLAASGIKTLVFVLDGSLRNLPMAVLHDGQQYLVEKYSIALSQGLQLLEPRSLVRERLKALTGGLTEARQGFTALPAVRLEVNQIASELPSEVLLDQQFIETVLQDQIQAGAFPVIHLATHGQFSSKAEDTFLLTWDGRINVKDLAQLLRTREGEDTNPLELLVLSACQTAAGDKRAVLGLAGLAVRSGARSTLATLWSVRDQSTAVLMSEFYRELTQSEVSKAEALRQAQLTLLKNTKYEHPFYWAPFILVGNWL
jgi:CHAT domain-containing protein